MVSKGPFANRTTKLWKEKLNGPAISMIIGQQYSDLTSFGIFIFISQSNPELKDELLCIIIAI